MYSVICCYRGTYGGCFATTLGSVCHELGHTFDLGHTPDGIMGRGFDNVNLVFTVQPCEDNERNSCNGNRYVSSPIYKELAQHSTVAFTRTLNVSYTMSSPMKRPRSKSQGESARTARSTEDISEANRNKLNINKSRNLDSPDRQQSQIPMTFKVEKDCIHWSKNCGVFLSFHRLVSFSFSLRSLF
jgi:Putative peptidase family.